jgi:hypothetical protein
VIQNKKTIDEMLELVLNHQLSRKPLCQETNVKSATRTHVQFTTMITLVNQMRLKRNDTNAHQNKKDNATKQPAKIGADQLAVHLSKDKMDAPSSTDGSFLNNEDMSDESGDSFAVNAAVADVSSFALTDIFMSHFDIQMNEDSFSRAQRFMERTSEACISGDESKLNEIELVSQDVKASLSLRPVGLALAKKMHGAASDQPLKTLV